MYLSLLLFLILSAIISYLFITYGFAIANKFDFTDKPDLERKKQSKAIPKSGGVSIWLAYVSLVTFLIFLGELNNQLTYVYTLLTIISFCTLLGFLDDLFILSARLRLAALFLLSLVAWENVAFLKFTNNHSYLNFLVFSLGFILIINSFNLIDNSDGSASLTGLTITGVLITLNFFQGENQINILLIPLFVSILVFLKFNWHPARIYLGDSGAYLLGALIYILSLNLVDSFLDLVAIFLLFALPIFDTLFVVYSRFQNRIHIFTAGRDHVAHKLVELGMSVPKAAIIMNICSLIPISISTIIFLR